MKKFKLNVILGLFFLVIIGTIIVWRSAGVKKDYREAWVTNEGIVLWGVSFSRKMINRYDVKPMTMLWIPNGYGWYRSEKVGKLLIDEKKKNLIDEVLFYNFGYIPNKIRWMEKNDDDLDYGSMGTFLGWKVVIELMIEKTNWLYKTEEIENIIEESDKIDRIVYRDLADTDLITEDFRLMILNGSGEGGLAAMVGRNFERAGFVVDGWQNSGEESETCILRVSNNFGNTLGGKVIQGLGWDCQTELVAEMPDNSAEIVLGKNLAKMINYQSYLKSSQ